MPPSIPCKHWRDCGSKVGGLCVHERAIAEQGEKPSLGVCLTQCRYYDGPARTAELIDGILKLPEAEPPDVPEPEPAIVRWLGMNWQGTPWPKRLRLRSPVCLARLPGCGCIDPVKQWWLCVRIRMFRRG